MAPLWFDNGRADEFGEPAGVPAVWQAKLTEALAAWHPPHGTARAHEVLERGAHARARRHHDHLAAGVLPAELVEGARPAQIGLVFGQELARAQPQPVAEGRGEPDAGAVARPVQRHHPSCPAPPGPGVVAAQPGDHVGVRREARRRPQCLRVDDVQRGTVGGLHCL